MRLFIAIKFSPEIENALLSLQSEMRKSGISGNYTKQENLHLTLAFIGESDHPDKVIEALNNVEFEPFDMSLEKQLGNFGDIIWIGIQKNPALMSLARKVRKALDDHHINYDRKSFRPHITLIRKAWSGTSNFIANNKTGLSEAKMTVDKFSLMQSQRISGKLVYTEIGIFHSRE